MRKWLLLFVSLLLLGLPFAAYAASISGIETQGMFKFNLGLDEDFVVSRDVTIDSPNGKVLLDSKIKNLNRTTLKLSVGLLPFLDLYAKLGGARYDFNANVIGGIGSVEAGGNWGLAYGVGTKISFPIKQLLFGKDLILGADLQYIRHKNSINPEVQILGIGSLSTLSTKGTATFNEWQVAPFVGTKIGPFVPYLGAKYSDIKVDFKDLSIESKTKVGMFAGLGFNPTKNLNVNLEGRFIDEYGFGVNLSYRF